MKRIKVKSSNIESIGWEIMTYANTDNLDIPGVLEVEFKGGNVYQYFGMPEKEYLALKAAESVGKYFNINIKKGGYEFKKVEEVKEETPIIASKLYDYLTVQLDLLPKTIEKLKPLLKGDTVFEKKEVKPGWQEEFEDKIFKEIYDAVGSYCPYVETASGNFLDIVKKYLLGKDDLKPQKVKIKCKDGMIQIERID